MTKDKIMTADDIWDSLCNDGNCGKCPQCTKEKFIPLSEHERIVKELLVSGNSLLDDQVAIEKDFQARVEEFRKENCQCVLKDKYVCYSCKSINKILLRRE